MTKQINPTEPIHFAWNTFVDEMSDSKFGPTDAFKWAWKESQKQEHAKEWVGLTENQIDKLEKEFIGFPVPNIYNFVQAIEAKLKDKNT